MYRQSGSARVEIWDGGAPLQNVQLEFNHAQKMPFMVQVHADDGASALDLATACNVEHDARRRKQEEELKAFQRRTQRRLASYSQARRASLGALDPALGSDLDNEDDEDDDGKAGRADERGGSRTDALLHSAVFEEEPSTEGEGEEAKVLVEDLDLGETKHRELDERSDLSRSLAETRSQAAAARRNLLAYSRGRHSLHGISHAGARSPRSQGLVGGENSFVMNDRDGPQGHRPPTAPAASADLDSSFQDLDAFESKKRIAARQHLVRKKEMAFGRLLARRRRAVLEHKRRVKDEQERLYQARCEREKAEQARAEAKLAESAVSAATAAAPLSPASSQASAASKKRRDKDESLRYIAALQRRLESLAENSKGVKLPYLCSCAAARGSNALAQQDGDKSSAPWELCASNCHFYNNPQAYAKEIADLFRSLEL